MGDDEREGVGKEDDRGQDSLPGVVEEDHRQGEDDEARGQADASVADLVSRNHVSDKIPHRQVEDDQPGCEPSPDASVPQRVLLDLPRRPAAR